MRVKIDSENDLAYIYLRDTIPPGGVAETVECECESGGTVVYLDFDKNGVLLGIDSLMASRTFPKEILEQAEEYES